MPRHRPSTPERVKSPGSPSCASACSIAEDIQCRLCFGEEDCQPGGRLICPCKCSGSVKYIHVRCLSDWQDVSRQQGQWKKSRHCEICKEPYRIPSEYAGATWFRRLLLSANQHVLEVLNCSSWPVLLYRAWKLYLLGTSVAGATRAGVVGLRAGFGMGRSLVQEQTSMLLQLLSAMAGVVGTPYAELIWFQAVACLGFGLLSEMVYTSILGLVVGTVFGFARGYLNAIKATLAVAGGSASRAVLAARGAAKLATSAPAHVLRALAAAAKYLPTCFFH